MRKLLAVALLWALALAGCNGGGHDKLDPITCPSGIVLSTEDIEASEHHHDAGFNATSLCPEGPQVLLTGLPASIQVYSDADFTWVVDNGSIPSGHSMLTSIRYATASVPDAELVEGQMAKYPNEVIKKEHQNLPVTFKGNLTFNVPGKVYVRAYAQVQGTGFNRTDVWSDEVVLDVTPVQPTGVVKDITHSQGAVAGELTPDPLDLVLGDGARLVNGDLVEHTLTMTSAPPGAPECTMAAGREAESDPCIFVVPGEYRFKTEDPQPRQVTVRVAAP